MSNARLLRLTPARILNRIHPAQLVFVSYMLGIVIGAALLMLPAATVSGSISWIDALFTATSAICVTGLAVVDTGSYFSAFGQMVILVLIQIGGLGIMTFSVAFFRLIGRQISFRERMAVQDVFTHTPGEDVYQLLRSIFLFTVISELVGVILLLAHWSHEFPFDRALYLAVFHAVSAFCNAGFSLFSNNLMDYRGSLLLNVTVGGLIVLGGIGFPTVYDLYRRYVRPDGKRAKMLAQTKVVLLTTLSLIVGGAALFWVLEFDHALAGLSLRESVLASVFQSITTRTAGFNTVDISLLSAPTLAMMLFLMFFGASPGSCGGGVKTTTLAIIGALAVSRLRREHRVNLFKKSVPNDTLAKSTVLLLLSIGLIAIFFFLLLVSVSASAEDRVGQQREFLFYLFETVSAFGTVGLSMGATGQLSLMGKIWIIILMLIGRVGVLTIAYVVAGTTPSRGIEHAEENIMVG